MPRGEGIHVVSSQEGWRLDGLTGRGPFRTQREAIQAGREAAQQLQTELVVHGRNGRIRMRNSYGTDPRRSRG